MPLSNPFPTLIGHRETIFTTLVLTPKLVVTGSQDGSLRLWSVSSADIVASLATVQVSQRNSVSSEVLRVGGGIQLDAPPDYEGTSHPNDATVDATTEVAKCFYIVAGTAAGNAVQYRVIANSDESAGSITRIGAIIDCNKILSSDQGENANKGGNTKTIGNENTADGDEDSDPNQIPNQIYGVAALPLSPSSSLLLLGAENFVVQFIVEHGTSLGDETTLSPPTVYMMESNGFIRTIRDLNENPHIASSEDKKEGAEQSEEGFGGALHNPNSKIYVFGLSAVVISPPGCDLTLLMFAVALSDGSIRINLADPLSSTPQELITACVRSPSPQGDPQYKPPHFTSVNLHHVGDLNGKGSFEVSGGDAWGRGWVWRVVANCGASDGVGRGFEGGICIGGVDGGSGRAVSDYYCVEASNSSLVRTNSYLVKIEFISLHIS